MAAMSITWERLESTEQALLELGSETRVVAKLTAELGVTAHTVVNWIKQVRARWAEGRAKTTREDRRAQLVAMVESVYASAMTNKVVVVDGDGNPRMVPVLDDYGQPVLNPNGTPKMVVMEVSKPDRRLALSAVDRLIELEGLGATSKHEVTVVNELISGTAVELAAAAAADDEALQRAARRLLPEGSKVIDAEAVDAGEGGGGN